MTIQASIAQGQDEMTSVPIAKGEQARPDPAIAALLEPIRERHGMPALGGAILSGDKLLGAAVVGVRKAGNPTKATLQDQFHLGSDTKAMTATLLALLVEDGKLKWETTLEEALPEYARTMNPAYRGITIEQLLAQRTGFSAETAARNLNLMQMHAMKGSQRENRRKYLEKILAEPPDAPVGQKFVYSNRNYIVAGAIAERAADQDWESLITARLFKPLRMTSAGFGAPGRKGRIDQPLPHIEKDGKPSPIEPGPLADNPPLLGPAGTVHASLPDWAKFVAAHLRGAAGQDGILPASAFQKMQKPSEGGQGYAFGWGMLDRPWGGGRVLSHSGSNTMNYAVVWAAPLKDFAVLVATNEGGDRMAAACDEAAAALIRHHVEATK
ncbi:MAG: serine hydrolase domain-containing protein [Isosphaeraceae bacterium]